MPLVERLAAVTRTAASPKGLCALLLAGALLFLAILSYPLLTGRVYIEDDLSAFSLPLRYFYQQCLRNGDSPIWMPSEFCGFYLHGEGQAGMYHPLHLVVYRFLPLSAAFNLELLINYPALLLGAFLLMRRWAIPRYAALFGAFFFTFCGFNLSNYLHIMMPSVIAHTPWLLLCIDVAMRTERPRVLAASTLAITLLTASQILLGFPQCVYFSCLIEGLYVLFLLPACTRRTRVIILGGAKLLALLIGAIQLLPQLDAAQHSIRLAPSREFIMAGSLHPLNLLQIVSPYLFNRHGWTHLLDQLWDPPYFGALAPVLVAWLWIRRRDLGSARRLIVGCLILGVLGIVLALGEYGYVYRAARFIPLLNKFRNSSRHLLLFHLALAFVIALAYADLHRVATGRDKVPWMRLWPLAMPALASAGIAVGVMAVRAVGQTAFWHEVDKHLAPSGNAVAGAALMAGAGLLVTAAARGRPLALVAIASFALLDLAAYGLRHKPSADLTAFVNAIEVPNDAQDCRIDPDYRPVYAYTGPTMKGVRVVIGYAAMSPTNELDYYRQTAALRVAGVRWRKSRLGGPPELARAVEQGVDWLEVADTMPRVRMVSRAIVSEDPHRDIETIDIAEVALVNRPVSLDEALAGRATLASDRPGELVVDTEAPGSQLLVVSERWHAGWHAEIDGMPADVVRAYGDLMGCRVDAGRHTVHLHFAPADLRQGKALAILGVVLTVFYTASIVRFGRRGKREEGRIASVLYAPPKGVS